jgi:hypothetical protein
MNRSVLRLLGLILFAGWVLSGCAGGYLLDNTVHSFSGIASLPAQPTYRFERLPSQQVPAQAQLEAMADPALHQAGLRRDDSNPRYTVQVSASILRELSPWDNRWHGGAWGFSRMRMGFGFGAGFGWNEPYWYRRDVAVIVRELPSNRVVFESHAVNDGPWVEDQKVFAAMFRAALHGFPNPPPGPRRVDIQMGA